MPRTKLGAENRKYDKLVALFRGTATTRGKTYRDLGKMAGCSPSTITVRFQRPETLTIEEVARLGRGLGIPIDELRQCLKY